MLTASQKSSLIGLMDVIQKLDVASYETKVRAGYISWSLRQQRERSAAGIFDEIFRGGFSFP